MVTPHLEQSPNGFQFHFLGTFAVSFEGRLLNGFRTDKERALLAYLALEGSQPVNRNVLTGLLWPDRRESSAKANLRQTLFRLRHTLDEPVSGGSDVVLSSTHHSLQFRAPVAAVDVLEFQEWVAASDAHPHDALVGCESCLLHMARAAQLYGGEFLAGISIPTAPYFEEWLLLKREVMHLQAIRTLTALALANEDAGDLRQANHWATRLVNLDAYREQSHRVMMRILARQGLPDQALERFGVCLKLLRDELGVEPDPETIALVERIRRGDFQKRAAQDPGPVAGAILPALSPQPIPVQIPSASDLEDSLRDVPFPGPFFGREAEQAKLLRWLKGDGPGEQVHVIAILGMGGVGKTTLAAHTVREAAAEAGARYDIAIWRSLLNAPPLDELLPPILRILSEQKLVDVPTALDEQLRLLIGYLRERRVLLVLDNIESILKAEGAGQYCAGYEPYGQLIEWVATRAHHSVLLLTSRERPAGYARLEGDGPFVRSLQLGGLDETASYALLAQRGLQMSPLEGSDSNAADLIRRYSGNPLALKLVADTVEGIFGGDTAGFLSEESLVFDDVRVVLDQQFARLSELEQTILFWLAVEREPTPISVLGDNLAGRPPQRALVEALRGLQRRSLVERADSGFILQNVVTEYLSGRLIETAIRELLTGELDLLHRVALLKAQAKEYVRQSQIRMLLSPVGDRLLGEVDKPCLATILQQLLIQLRLHDPRTASYAGGNILNLLLHLQIDLTGFDFSRLTIWQAYLRDAALPDVNFSGADFAQIAIADRFGDVRSLAFSPDGELVAAGTAAGEVSLWKTSDADLVAVLNDDAAPIWSIAFSRDGALLASGGTDRIIRLWDVASASLCGTLLGHSKTIRCVAFSPDGATVASGSDDRTVRLWDVQSRQLRQTLQDEHAHSVRSVAFSPDGKSLASGSDDHKVILWALDTGKPQRALHGHTGWVTSVAISPVGRILATGSFDGKVLIWDMRTGEILYTLIGHNGWVETIAFSPDGKVLASGGDDRVVRLWNVDTGRLHDVLPGHSSRVKSIAYSRDGDQLASGDIGRNIYLWNARSRQPRHRLLGHLVSVETVAFSPHGDLLASGNRDQTVRFWRRAKEEIEPALQYVPIWRPINVGPVIVIAFSPDGKCLASGCADRTIRLDDVTGDRIQRTLHGHDGEIKSIAFGPDGRMLASGGTDQSIRLWDTESGQLLHTIAAHDGWVNGLAFGPDGDVLASTGADETIGMWDAHSGRLLRTFKGHVGWVNDVEFTPDGAVLVSAGADGAVRLWDLLSGSLIQTLSGHDGWVWKVAVTDDGNTLVSGSHDRTVCVWDISALHTGGAKLRHILKGHAPWVTDISINSRSRILAISSGNQNIRLWNIDSGEPIQTLRIPSPYEGMNIAGATGISMAQREAMKSLGAVESTHRIVSARAKEV